MKRTAGSGPRARESTPGGRDLATSGGCTRTGPGFASRLARLCQPSGE